MRISRPALSLSLFLLLSCFLLHLLNLFGVKTDTSRYLMLRELREAHDIDVLFVGSSPIYYGIDPEIIRAGTGYRAIDAAIGNMGLEGAIALTELAFKTNRPKYVCLALEPETLLSVQESEEAEVRIMPMLPPDAAAHYLSNLSDSDSRFLTRLFYFRSMPVDSPEDLLKTISIRFHPEPYIEEMNEKLSDTPYRGAGYHEMLLEPPEGGLFANRLFLPSEDTYVELPYLTMKRIQKIQKLCSAHGAQLIVSILPLPATALLSNSAAMQACDLLETFCHDLSIPFINASRARQSWLPDLNSFFVDIYHLNKDGAALYSNALCKLLLAMDRGEEIQSLQYPSWTDFLDGSTQIFSTYATVRQADDLIEITAGCFAGTNVQPFYQFELIQDDGTTETLQSWQPDNCLSVPRNLLTGHSLVVRAAMDASGSGAMIYNLNF